MLSLKKKGTEYSPVNDKKHITNEYVPNIIRVK